MVDDFGFVVELPSVVLGGCGVLDCPIDDPEYATPGQVRLPAAVRQRSGQQPALSAEHRIRSLEVRIRYVEATVQRLIEVLEVQLGVVGGVALDDEVRDSA